MRHAFLLGFVATVAGIRTPRIDTDICRDVLMQNDPLCSELLSEERKIDAVVALFGRVSAHSPPALFVDPTPLTPFDGILIDTAIGMFLDTVDGWNRSPWEARLTTLASSYSLQLLDAIFDRAIARMESEVNAKRQRLVVVLDERKAAHRRQLEAERLIEAQKKAEAAEQREALKQANALKRREAQKQAELRKRQEAQKRAEAERRLEAEKRAEAAKRLEAEKQANLDRQKQLDAQRLAREKAERDAEAEREQAVAEALRLARKEAKQLRRDKLRREEEKIRLDTEANAKEEESVSMQMMTMTDSASAREEVEPIDSGAPDALQVVEAPSAAETKSIVKRTKKERKAAAREAERIADEAIFQAALDANAAATAHHSRLHELKADRRGALRTLDEARMDLRKFERELDGYRRERRESDVIMQERLPMLKRQFESFRDKSNATVPLTEGLRQFSDSMAESVVRIYECEDREIQMHTRTAFDVLLLLKRSNLTDNQMWAVCERAYHGIVYPSVHDEIEYDIEMVNEDIYDTRKKIETMERRVASLADDIRRLS